MGPTIKAKNRARVLKAAGLTISLVALSSCQLFNIKRQSEEIDGATTVAGHIDVPDKEAGQVYVMLARPTESKFEVINKVVVPRSGNYRLNVFPGDYFIGAFVDSNGDELYQSSEPATYLGIEKSSPTTLHVVANAVQQVDAMSIRGTLEVDASKFSYKMAKPYENVGRIVTLDDPMFSSDSVSMGFWRALDYASEYGGGLMMLQAWEPNKIPIVFVHGIFGSAHEFKDVIASLDRSKYQPWVMHYPSGAPLDVVSDYLADALGQLQAKYGFKEVIVIAHSMGGLVTRSFVMKHQLRNSRYKIAAVMTINSPLYGMDSAASGVKSSPIVVPVWRDVASGSDFVKRVHEWHWPKDIPYYLIFSYQPEEEGDGVVPLRSQLSPSLQDEATSIFGFQAQHAGILTDKEFIRRFNQLLTKPR